MASVVVSPASATIAEGSSVGLMETPKDAGGTHGGGKVAWVGVSGKSKEGYQPTALYQHQSALRLSSKVLGVTAFPNAAFTALDMGELFTPVTAVRMREARDASRLTAWARKAIRNRSSALHPGGRTLNLT